MWKIINHKILNPAPYRDCHFHATASGPTAERLVLLHRLSQMSATLATVTRQDTLQLGHFVIMSQLNVQGEPATWAHHLQRQLESTLSMKCSVEQLQCRSYNQLTRTGEGDNLCLKVVMICLTSIATAPVAIQLAYLLLARSCRPALGALSSRLSLDKIAATLVPLIPMRCIPMRGI
jgi:hypothetical protein